VYPYRITSISVVVDNLVYQLRSRLAGEKEKTPKKHITTDNENGSGECSRMAGPYLKSGESIILTTDRVMIDESEYDLILTSQRLALVDSAHTAEQPQEVPFATILSVKGGSTPAHEPFITLTVIDPIGLEDSGTIDLIFSQHPYEDRAAECDLWVQKLIEHIVSVRQGPAPAVKQPVPVKSRGMHATVRRFEAPEKPRPHSQVTRTSRRPSEELLSAIQETAGESPDNLPETPPAQADQTFPEEGGYHESGIPSPAPAGDDEGTSPVFEEPVTGSGSPAESAGVISPPAPGQERPDASLIDENRAKTDERTDPAAIPVTPSDGLVPKVSGGVQEDTVPVQQDGVTGGSAAQVPEEEPAPAKLKARARKPAKKMKKTTPAPAKTVQPESSPGYAYPALPDIDDRGDIWGEEPARLPVDKPVQAGTPGMSPPGSREPIGLPDSVVFPVISGPVPDTIPEIPPEKKIPAVQAPAGQPPAPQAGKIPVRVMAAIGIVLLIIICAAAITLIYPAGNPNGSDHPAVTPTLTPLSITTIPTVVIPSEGVWVMVAYNGTYYGKYGNPGNLREVRGTGEQFYPIKDSNDLVQASFQKLDYSGNNLTVEVYNNGKMITQVNRSAPGGTISILVNSTTGKAPYVPVITVSA
jgi:hypothetical protein